MAKSLTPADWRCPNCKKTLDVTSYNKKNNEKIMKEKSKFCNQCREHVKTFRKDTSKGSLGNKK
ncbi:MAG: hypothetical protein UT55_C0048G0017 [Candidatus Peregrinibacteria bacterium GW2011_GWE2_39_6]|nr:MAG: hypothetical protein UT36_C0004G0106 [Candidatus Peregrinibacteria bacterium GW2011_GWF2_39_17]KKR25186.1 MAG: hypothetical protein UT55_C0048G0017 [Candidatus Peregrinibacteria bacterium GW2011_GWE2_39_6]HCW32205.1 hypothetical protein [Candidatus Peregrinibacteria bacterium]